MRVVKAYRGWFPMGNRANRESPLTTPLWAFMWRASKAWLILAGRSKKNPPCSFKRTPNTLLIQKSPPTLAHRVGARVSQLLQRLRGHLTAGGGSKSSLQPVSFPNQLRRLIVSDHLKRHKLKGWILVLWAVICALLLTAADPTSSTATISTSSTGPSFTEFESGQVRPLAISPDRTKLFAINTPDNTLEIFSITSEGLALRARVPVGLEPVAVAPRNDNEVWVVNHLSDSVSVVSLTPTPRVTRTLLVGDEPRDIVFAGSPSRAFIAT